MMRATIAITEIVTTFTELFSRVCNIFMLKLSPVYG